MNDQSLTIQAKADKPSLPASPSRRDTMSVRVENVSDAIEVATLMSRSLQGVPKAFRDQPGLCFAVVWQAASWNMNPFNLAREAYVVNDQVAFMAKAIKAAVDMHAPLDEPLDFSYAGEGESLTCTCTGKIITRSGKIVERTYESPPVGKIPTKNSPLWKSDVRQQLAYFSARSWARLHAPQVIAGVYDTDEIDPRKNPSVIDRTPRAPLEERLKKAAPAKLPYANAAQADEDEDADRDDTSQTQEPDSPARLMIGEAEAFDSATDLAEWSESLRQSEDFKALSQDERKTVNAAIARKSLALMEAAGEAETSEETGETGDGDDAEETFPGDLTS